MTCLPIFDDATETCDRYLDNLIGQLASVPLELLESPGNPGIAMAKKAGLSGLLIPEDFGGLGATAVDAVLVQFALGRAAPSTAVAITMHQFTVATLVELVRETPGMEWIVLEAIATNHLLVASGFAEGRPDGKILSPSMTLTADGPSFRLTGVKEPCSLTASMDLMTVSVKMPLPSDEFAIALIPASGEGVVVESRWSSSVLAGAETAAVLFEQASVPRAALSYVGASSDLDRVQIRGYLWFELCITSTYLGVASRLVEMVVRAGRANNASLVTMAGELESALSMLDHLGRRIDDGEASDALLSRMLLVRFAVERSIQRLTDVAFELLGVGGLSQDPAVGNLLAASRALSFHPPSRRRCEDNLAGYLGGGPLVLE